MTNDKRVFRDLDEDLDIKVVDTEKTLKDLAEGVLTPYTELLLKQLRRPQNGK